MLTAPDEEQTAEGGLYGLVWLRLMAAVLWAAFLDLNGVRTFWIAGGLVQAYSREVADGSTADCRESSYEPTDRDHTAKSYILNPFCFEPEC